MPREQRAEARIGLNASWAMAVGGMIGGGIFSVLGVVYELAGGLTWLSFVLGALVALVTARSYATLAHFHGEGGGAFTYLRNAGHDETAATIVWVLILAYILTLAVYAFTFGRYFAEITGGGQLVAHLLAVAILATLVAVNVTGVKEASGVAIATVYAKLAVLLSLAAAGLWAFDSKAVAYPAAEPGGLLGAVVGAGAVFMAYEGFQLLSYDFEVMHRPRRTLKVAMYTAIPVVALVYVAVALAAASLLGARALVATGEVSLAAAGQEAWGTAGKVVVSLGALFAAASAINATLFATSRLVQTVAGRGELPGFLRRENRAGVPVTSLVLLGLCGAVLAVATALGRLVEAASLVFLVTFGIVNLLAALRRGRSQALSWCGLVACAGAGAVLGWRIAVSDPVMFAVLTATIVAVVGARRLRARRSGPGRPDPGGLEAEARPAAVN